MLVSKNWYPAMIGGKAVHAEIMSHWFMNRSSNFQQRISWLF